MSNQENPSPAKGKIEDEFESRDFQVLESEFQAVLKEIGGDRQLEHFHREYEKHYRILLASHENEKKLIKKCKELNSNITESTLKVQQAFRMSKEENDNIRNFQTDLERAVKTLETFKQKETAAKQQISHLKEDISRLSVIVEQGSGLAIGQDSTVNELIRTKEELIKEVSLASENIAKAQKEYSELNQRILKLETMKNTLREEVSTANKDIQDLKGKLDDESKLKLNIETKLNTEKGNFEGILSMIREREQQGKEIADQKSTVMMEIAEVDEQKKDNEFKLNEAMKKKALAEERKLSLENIKEENMKRNEAVESSIIKSKQELHSKEDNRVKLQRDKVNIEKKNEALKAEKKEAETIRDKAREHMHSLIKESEMLRKGTETDQSAIDALKRERDMMAKAVMKARDNVRSQEDTSITMNNNKKKLENEIKKYSKDIKKLKDKVWQLQKEQERYGLEKAHAYSEYSLCLEEVKVCNSAIAEMQRKNIEAEAKLKQQQNLFDAVRTDRNLYSKNLIESYEEIDELDKKKKIMIHQISQLKEEIGIKDTELIQENKKQGIVEKAKNELESAKILLSEKETSLSEAIKKSEKENQRLKYVITEVEQEKAKQKKELELVTNERDILGTQLIRRKEELDLLYKKIKIFTSTLEKGKQQYKERLADITVLKEDIADLKTKLDASKKEASVVFDLKKEKYYLEREVLDEKVKVKALSEEVENTMNVHRWRKVEGTEPEKYELITKIQTLQRRFISKNQECLEKKMELDDMEKSYNKLKISLARHPGPESIEKIDECRRVLYEKKGQMTNMEEELDQYQKQASQYKLEIERLSRELQEVKKNYFTIKKKEQLVKEQELRAEGKDKPIIKRHPPPQRFTGGGFNLAI